MKAKFNCPAEMTISLIGGKWKAILVYNLRKGPKRFGELKRRSPGITSATLSQQLRELEEAKIVKRNQMGADLTFGVEYSLTQKGEDLRPVINAMIRFGIAYQKEHVIGDFGMATFQRVVRTP